MIFISERQVERNGKIYQIVEKAEANVVDSFVSNSNKIGNGSGEARLYVASQRESRAFFQFDPTKPVIKSNKSYAGCPHPCFLLKDNLMQYMEDVFVDYHYPAENYRKKHKFPSLYEERQARIHNLSEEKGFKIYQQNGEQDTNRFYIGSADDAWDLIRDISLPVITALLIYKLENIEDDRDICYYFELLRDPEQRRAERSTPKRTVEDVEREIWNDDMMDETEKEAVVRSRRGQGKFRKETLACMQACPFTGIRDASLLRASHIRPWAECENNRQRLDPWNGLALTPTYDLLFDRFLISFENDGRLLVSGRLSDDLRVKLALREGEIYEVPNEDGKRNAYLRFHRSQLRK